MYAVIFKATFNDAAYANDEEYVATARALRALAFSEYGCIDFVACTEGKQELAVSYWPSLEHIKAWHQDPAHQRAQALGKAKWYETYSVTVSQTLS